MQQSQYTSPMNRRLTDMQEARVAIVDIGSNSLRIVIYDQLKRAAVPLYNEKVMCQLGKGLASSGRLNPEGVAMAESAVRRFLALARTMDVRDVYVMATAAVRDAQDGKAFARALEKEHGITVDIISGEREAKLGAYGVCASVHAPSGLSADLGGGSLELVRLEGAEQLQRITLPLGPLRLLDQTGGDRSDARKTIERELRGASWLAENPPRNLYAIGGSFRAIAKLHMREQNYPLEIVHEYAVAAKPMTEFARSLAEMGTDKLEKTYDVPARRAAAIPVAAQLMAQLMEAARPERIVFSGSGIREGYLYEMLKPDTRAQDPLIAACLDLAARKPRVVTYAKELMQWMEPLAAGENYALHRLRWAFCLLVDIAHHIHPEYRAQWAFERVLFSSFTGISHRERVQLGLALYHRYHYKLKSELPVVKLLENQDKQWARLMGAAANLAYHITGGLPGTLARAPLAVEKKALSLALSGEALPLAGETVDKRVAGVAEAYAKWKE